MRTIKLDIPESAAERARTERFELIEALARDFRGSTEQSIDAKLDWIMTALLFILKEKR